MKSKLSSIFLILLILLNGILIFMLLIRPHEARHRPEPNFLIETLQFNEVQKNEFRALDNTHRGVMMNFDEQLKEQKDILFNSFYKENFNADSLTAKIGFIEEKKHAELYRFFSKVRAICSKEQAQTFDKIIQKALRAGDRRPPKEERMPPREHGMPPPKK